MKICLLDQVRCENGRGAEMAEGLVMTDEEIGKMIRTITALGANAEAKQDKEGNIIILEVKKKIISKKQIDKS